MIGRIETERLVLRKAREDDLDAIWGNVWRDERIARWMLWEVTRSRDDALARMERTRAFQKEQYAYFVCLKETDEPIGFAGIRETAPGEFEETGICVSYAHQGRGYGKEILRSLVDLAFEKLGGSCFRYGCFHENAASAAVCKGCGFRYSHSEACVRKWDGYEYQCDFYKLTR